MDKTTTPFQPERHRDRLRILARIQLRGAAFLQHKIDSSDIVQEALLQAHAVLPQFRGKSEAEFAGWLRAILASKLADAVRHLGRKKRDAALEESFRQNFDESSRRIDELAPDKRTSPSQHVVLQERAGRLAKAMDALPADQRTAVEFHHLEGCSVLETAKRMGRTTAAVSGLLRRGLKTLRQSLEGQLK